MIDCDKIIADIQAQIKSIQDLQSLDQIRVQYLGKKGELTEVLKTLSQLPAEERKVLGQRVNEAKEMAQKLFSSKAHDIKNKILEEKLSEESIDVTLPGRGKKLGSLHPVMQVRDRIEEIFKSMGFDVAEGPEIESEYFNFEALNIPKEHPARAMADTFYFDDDLLLRTHTSPVQIRYMQNNQPPIRMLAPGRVYRRDFDATHTPMFHQMEGLLIDQEVSFADLKGILNEFMHLFFENPNLKTRFRPSYFPFTEPSAEMDVECVMCNAKGCRVCKNSGWLEMYGCGMVHPNVLKFGGIDPEKFTGYAFGLGMDRLAMIYYKINDLRLLFENDIRFLGQF